MNNLLKLTHCYMYNDHEVIVIGPHSCTGHRDKHLLLGLSTTVHPKAM